MQYFNSATKMKAKIPKSRVDRLLRSTFSVGKRLPSKGTKYYATLRRISRLNASVPRLFYIQPLRLYKKISFILLNLESFDDCKSRM
jgi:hypothetical protein